MAPPRQYRAAACGHGGQVRQQKNLSAMDFFRHFLLAVQFFTRIPITGKLAAWVGYSPDMLRRSAAHFPGVGWIVGATAAAIFGATLFLFKGQAYSSLVAAALSTLCSVWLTGGFHEDGLADTCDGLGGGSTREKALRIMKDSRIGSYGTLALVLALILKISLLALLGTRSALAGAAALAGAHVLSRAAQLPLMRGMAYVGEADGSKAKPLADDMSTAALAAGLLWAAPAAWLLAAVHGWGAAAAALAAMLAALAWMACLLQRRLQGFTGDALGATQQVCELALYLGLAAVL